MIAIKLGLRNLFRNRWRSGLTLAAVAVAVGLMVWTLGFYEGWIQQLVRGATAVSTTQAQIHTAGYIEAPRVYRTFTMGEDRLRRIVNLRGVDAVSPRVELAGLIGNEERSQVARFLGVRPELEAAATPVTDGILEGRWLAGSPPEYPAPREIVLGEGLARRLRVDIGAELVVFLEAADGSLGNELLEVVGILRTQNTEIDRMTGYLHLEDAQYLAALGDGVHEVAIRAEDPSRARAIADTVAATLRIRPGAPEEGAVERGEVDGDALVVRPWQEIMPSMAQMVVLFRQSYAFMYLIIYLVAAIGILNTQRMSALERKREFGVMMAIGMRPRRMFRTLVVETLVLGTVGALIGAVGGAALTWYHATAGFDMTLFTDQATFSMMGVAFSERIYFELYPGAVVEPVAVMLVVALLSGLWPAVKSARIDPAPTIAGRA
ncbi:MAG: FtsX-like permease family protein [Longimicrobiales bacterium]|nr:FtsX-like permease family protein [Longimicrobiales bacterium]